MKRSTMQEYCDARQYREAKSLKTCTRPRGKTSHREVEYTKEANEIISARIRIRKACQNKNFKEIDYKQVKEDLKLIGKDVNQQYKIIRSSTNLLTMALESENPKMVRLLVEHGANTKCASYAFKERLREYLEEETKDRSR